MNLKGKTAVITGASGHIGSAIALALGRVGCNCVCQYHNNRERAEQIVKQITGFGQKGLAVRADLTNEKDIKEMFERAGEVGKVQILVNCAAVFERTPLEEINFEQVQGIFSINLMAAIMTSKYFAMDLAMPYGKAIKEKLSRESGPAGKITNIADVGGIRPWAEYSLYCASKAALIAVTKSLAKELAPRICVNAVAPGIVTWPEGFDERQKERQLSLVPLKRIADIGEVTKTVIFLIENDYITGQTICVDGGRGI